MSTSAAISEAVSHHQQSRPRQWLLILNSILIALACTPWLIAHAQRLWAKPHYQFFPMVLAGSLVLAARARKGLDELRPGPAARSGFFLALGWAILVLAG